MPVATMRVASEHLCFEVSLVLRPLSHRLELDLQTSFSTSITSFSKIT